MCLACSLTCHDNCELIELYTKRNFRCDCPTGKFERPCQFGNKSQEKNDKNIYGQNFEGKYCSCARPYPDPDCPPELLDDEMIQCVLCEDWFHGTHLGMVKKKIFIFTGVVYNTGNMCGYNTGIMCGYKTNHSKKIVRE